VIEVRVTSKVSARSEQHDLFINLAEQVKQPLVHISHAAEIMDGLSDPEKAEKTRKSIALVSRNTLRLIDAYLLSVELQRSQQLALEPVSISSVLYDTGELLDEYAKANECNLEIQINGKYGPVMTHKKALQAALVSLGLGFIEAAFKKDSDQRPIIKLSVKRGPKGIITGVYSSNEGIGRNLLSRARILQGKARQPMADFDNGNGAGIFLADALFSSLDTTMRIAKLQGLHGLAATLQPSRQLSLV
jgi:light-regulated signal transduction histidine kinase (bacteriophytochrome)